MKLLFRTSRTVWLLRSNKRKRSIVLKFLFNGSRDPEYREYILTSEDFDYYISHNHANQQDWICFVNNSSAISIW